jgi:hypothetical protein
MMKQGAERSQVYRHQNTTGDFICFLDSDDYVAVNFIQVLFDTVLNDGSDVCACNFWKDTHGNIFPCETNFKDSKFEVDVDSAIDVAKRVNPGCTNKTSRLDILRFNSIYKPGGLVEVTRWKTRAISS